MLTDYVIMPGADYQDACDAIREKTGKTDAIVSGDMGEEIRGISGGGMGVIWDEVDSYGYPTKATLTHLINGYIPSYCFYGTDAGSDLTRSYSVYKKLKEVSCLEDVYGVGEYAFYGCKSIELSEDIFSSVVIIGVGAFKTANTPVVNALNLEVADKDAFSGSTLTSAYFPKLVTTGTSCFYSCSKLESIAFPVLTTCNNQLLSWCLSLKNVDFFVCEKIKTEAFRKDEKLKNIFIRTNTLCTLDNILAFKDTPLYSGGTGGRGFVPRDLITTYQEATNWSTLYAAGTCTFLALEDYTVDGTTTGEMDWDKVNALDEEVTA